jgi:ferredoxin
MRVVTDLTRCQGYANCLGEAPDVFDLDESTNLVKVLQEHPPEGLREVVQAAARVCPVQAITIEDDG